MVSCLILFEAKTSKRYSCSGEYRFIFLLACCRFCKIRAYPFLVLQKKL